VIALIEYGAGNLASVRKALSALGAEFTTPSAADELARCDGIIVPGVGHYAATQSLDDAWRAAIRAAVDGGTPLLGICLGMQWLFDGSEEAPALAGLGIFPGTCARLAVPAPLDLRPRLKVPHVGWNSLALPRASAVMAGVVENAQVYFTHSYAAPVVDEAAALTRYGMPFSAAVERGRVAGVQFHPEKSGDVGLRILRNWLDLARSQDPKTVSQARRRAL
jgi:glutamine amidotransferase